MTTPLVDLQGKVIVITGGASGIGLATAQIAQAAGATVVCADVKAPQALPAGLHFVPLDTADEASVNAAIDRVLLQHGHIDGLVTSAGIAVIGDVQELSLAEWQRSLDVNLTGTMLACRAVAGHMRQRGQGAIVTIASINGMLGNQGNLAYCATKGGVLQMTRCLAADLGRAGVRVNSISPGLITTPMTAMLQAGNPVHDAFVRLHLLNRAGLPQEVGRAIAFLLSDAASFITGANLPVDGGFSAAKVIGLEMA